MKALFIDTMYKILRYTIYVIITLIRLRWSFYVFSVCDQNHSLVGNNSATLSLMFSFCTFTLLEQSNPKERTSDIPWD